MCKINISCPNSRHTFNTFKNDVITKLNELDGLL